MGNLTAIRQSKQQLVAVAAVVVVVVAAVPWLLGPLASVLVLLVLLVLDLLLLVLLVLLVQVVLALEVTAPLQHAPTVAPTPTQTATFHSPRWLLLRPAATAPSVVLTMPTPTPTTTTCQSAEREVRHEVNGSWLRTCPHSGQWW
jgi:hypothetical protein